MRLPKDTGEWHERHLQRAVEHRDRLFAVYEAKVDFTNLESSELLFATYLRADGQVERLLLVLYGSRA